MGNASVDMSSDTLMCLACQRNPRRQLAPHAHTHTHARTYTHTHAHAHTHTHAHTHAHTHPLVSKLAWGRKSCFFPYLLMTHTGMVSSCESMCVVLYHPHLTGNQPPTIIHQYLSLPSIYPSLSQFHNFQPQLLTKSVWVCMRKERERVGGAAAIGR